MFATSLDAALQQLAANDPSRKELSLSSKGMDDAECRQLCESLSANTTLNVLDLQSNRLTPASAAYLADTLRTNDALTELNLENNTLTDVGAAHLSKLLDENHMIRALHLEMNQISPALMEEVAHKCRLNTQPLALKKVMPLLQADDASLVELDLSMYHNAPLACHLLVDTLKSSTHLKSLNLANIGVQDKGSEVFAGLLRKSTTLQSFDLSNNGIGMYIRSLGGRSMLRLWGWVV